MKHSTINISDLKKTAEENEAGEAYIIHDKQKTYEIRTGIKIQPSDHVSLIIEVVISFCNTKESFDMNHFENQLKLVKILNGKGYEISCEEGFNLICEKIIEKEDLTNELEQIKKILDEKNGGN